MNVNYKYYLFYFVCILKLNIQAQINRLYDTRDGLSSNYIRSIVTDKNNYLWIGSQNGLMKFDGYKFLPYNVKNVDSTLSYSKGCFSIMCDKLNRIWIANSSGAVYYDQLNCRFYYPKIKNVNQAIYFRGFCCDNNGTVFICGDDGLFYFNEKENLIEPLFSTFGGFKTNIEINWNSIAYDSIRNGIWCGTSKRGMAFWDLKNKKLKWILEVFPQFKNNLKEAPISSVKIDEHQRLWFAYSRTGEVFYINLKNNHLQKLYFNHSLNEYDHYILSISKETNNRIWITDKNYGIYYLNNNDSIIHQYGSNYGLVFNVIHDVQKNVWFSTSKGLIRINRMELEVEKISLTKYLHSDFSFPQASITKDSLNNLWINSTHDGYYVFNSKNKTISNKRVQAFSSPSNNIYRTFQNNNIILSATWNNAFYLNQFGKFQNLFNENSEAGKILKNEIIYGIAKFNQSWYINIRMKGIFRFGLNGELLSKIDANNYPTRTFYGFKILSNGNILVTTDKSGVMLLTDFELKILKIWSMNSTHKDSLSNGRIEYLYEDMNHLIWLSSYSSIQILNLDQNKFYHYESLKNLESQSIPFYEDNTYIYINNVHRIFKINKNRFIVEGSITNSELQLSGFEGSAIELNNNIWVVSNKNLLRIPINLISKNNLISNIEISGIKLFNEYKFDNLNSNSIFLNYRDNFFTLDFTDFDFAQMTGKKIRYKLSGFNEIWMNSDLPSVSYTNVPSGDYELFLEVLYPNGNVFKKRFSIFISTPWWKSWWFFTIIIFLIIMFIICVIYIIIRRRINKHKSFIEKIQLIQQERLRISSEIHDDLGSELTSIKLMSEIIKQKDNHDTIKSIATEINFISDRTNRLIEGLNQIIWAINPGNDQSVSLISYSRSYLSNYLSLHQIPYKIEIPKFIPEFKIHAEKRQNFFLCVKEITHNIVKHSSATQVHCIFKIENNILYFIAIDNGKVDPDYQSILKSHIGNGLRHIFKRMESIGGSFEIVFLNGTVATIQMQI